MKAVFTSKEFLVRQEVAIRGIDFHSANLVEMLELRAKDTKDLPQWLATFESIEKRRLLSHGIQNEVLSVTSGHFAAKRNIQKMDKISSWREVALKIILPLVLAKMSNICRSEEKILIES